MLDQTVVEDVERDLLQEVIKRLDQQQLTEAEAQQLAKDFLALLPFQDKKDLLNKLSEFSKSNSEATGVYLKYLTPYEEEERLKKIELMSSHIKTGKIDEALAVAKGGAVNA